MKPGAITPPQLLTLRSLPDILGPVTSRFPVRRLLSLLQSMLDDLELESTYNPLQVWSHLYSHLSSTFANPHGRFHPSSKSRAVRKVLPSFPIMPRMPKSSSPVPHPREILPDLLWNNQWEDQWEEKPFALDKENYNPYAVLGLFLLGHLHKYLVILIEVFGKFSSHLADHCPTKQTGCTGTTTAASVERRWDKKCPREGKLVFTKQQLFARFYDVYSHVYFSDLILTASLQGKCYAHFTDEEREADQG